MPEIGTSGSMSGDGKRSDCLRLKPPRPSSTLPALLWRLDARMMTAVPALRDDTPQRGSVVATMEDHHGSQVIYYRDDGGRR